MNSLHKFKVAFCNRVFLDGFISNVVEDKAVIRIDNGESTSYGITAFVNMDHVYSSPIEYGYFLAKDLIKRLKRDMKQGLHQ